MANKVHKLFNRQPSFPETTCALSTAADIAVVRTGSRCGKFMLRKKEEALHKERETLDRKHRAPLEKLQGQLGRAEDRYRDALTRWRSD